jgi:hypothetical protein
MVRCDCDQSCASSQTGFDPLTEPQQKPYHGHIAVPGRVISLYFVPYEFATHKGTTVPDTLPGHIQVFDVCFAPLFAFQFE